MTEQTQRIIANRNDFPQALGYRTGEPDPAIVIDRASRRRCKPPLKSHLAVLKVMAENMHAGRRVRLGHKRLAAAAGCCIRTVQDAEVRLVEIGAAIKTHGGGGFRGATNLGIANEFRITALGLSLVGNFSMSAKPAKRARKVADMEIHQALPDVPLSNHKTITPARAKTGDKSPRSTATATSKAGLQESDTGRRQGPSTFVDFAVKPPLPADDPDLNAYLSFACAFLAGTSTQKVRRAFFAVCRRAGVDKAQLLPAYRAHTAHCLRRRYGLKRPDTFLLHAGYFDDWPVVEVETVAAPQGPSAAELEADHRAKLERLRAQIAADAEADEDIPADPGRVMATILAVVGAKTPQEVRRSPSRTAIAELTKPKGHAAPIDEPWEVYWTRAQAKGFSEDIARRSWEGNRAKA